LYAVLARKLIRDNEPLRTTDAAGRAALSPPAVCQGRWAMG